MPAKYEICLYNIPCIIDDFLEILDKRVNFASMKKSLFSLAIKINESSYLKYGSESVKIAITKCKYWNILENHLWYHHKD